MSAFVLDTSIALKWFLEDESDHAYSLAILGSLNHEYRPIVPWLWYYEMANVLPCTIVATIPSGGIARSMSLAKQSMFLRPLLTKVLEFG